MSLHKGLDGPEAMGGGYLVEYQYEGNWYTVYRPEGETEESYLGEEREVNLVKAVARRAVPDHRELQDLPDGPGLL